MNNKAQNILSLHKYWMQANRMRADLAYEMGKLSENTNIEDIYQYCSRTNNIAIHTYRDFWLASLFTVIQGYKTLKLTDDKINNLILTNEKGIKELKDFRDSTRHFELPLERNKKMKKLSNLSIVWLQEIHSAFGKYLFEEVNKLKSSLINE